MVAGGSWGRVKAMFDDAGGYAKKAGPATPVGILGLNEVPRAGDTFQVGVADDKAARRNMGRSPRRKPTSATRIGRTMR